MEREPDLPRFLARHAAMGGAAAAGMAAVAVWLDLAGLRGLILGSDQGALAFAMLLVFFALTGASVAMGQAIMRLHRKD